PAGRGTAVSGRRRPCRMRSRRSRSYRATLAPRRRRAHHRVPGPTPTSWLDDRQDVPVWVAEEEALPEPEGPTGRGDDARGRDAARAAPDQSRHRLRIPTDQRGLPVDEIVGSGVGRHGATVPRGQVLEELDARAGGRSQRGDPQVSSENVVQAFL